MLMKSMQMISKHGHRTDFAASKEPRQLPPQLSHNLPGPTPGMRAGRHPLHLPQHHCHLHLRHHGHHSHPQRELNLRGQEGSSTATTLLIREDVLLKKKLVISANFHTKKLPCVGVVCHVLGTNVCLVTLTLEG